MPLVNNCVSVLAVDAGEQALLQLLVVSLLWG